MSHDTYYSVEGSAQYQKNPAKGSVLNKDDHAYTARRRKIAIEHKKDKTIEQLLTRIERLESQINRSGR